jgi:hypothetical protein
VVAGHSKSQVLAVGAWLSTSRCKEAPLLTVVDITRSIQMCFLHVEKSCLQIEKPCQKLIDANRCLNSRTSAGPKLGDAAVTNFPLEHPCLCPARLPTVSTAAHFQSARPNERLERLQAHGASLHFLWWSRCLPCRIRSTRLRQLAGACVGGLSDGNAKRRPTTLKIEASHEEIGHLRRGCCSPPSPSC